MKQFIAFVRKEFQHVFRDPKTMLMLFGLPILQILLFGFALSNEIKNARIMIMDYSGDEATQAIIEKFRASDYFTIVQMSRGKEYLTSEFQKDNVKLTIVFPVNFRKNLLGHGQADIQLVADASDPNTATTLVQYASSIILAYQQNLNTPETQSMQINTQTKMIYNPQLSSAQTFVPGLIAVILLLVCVLMTSITIVREKEKGTMEVLLVSPVHPLIIVTAKAVPYLFLSLVNLAVILLLSVFLLDMSIEGSLLLLIGESVLLILTALSLGLLISTLTNSQETAMLIALMGMLLPTFMFTGFLFPLENMPVALQYFADVLPSRWFYVIAKSIMIKGLGFVAVWKETLILLGMTLILLTLSINLFKSRLT